MQLVVLAVGKLKDEGLEAACEEYVTRSRTLLPIVREATRLLRDPDAYAAMAGIENPYGDGRAAGRIAAACRQCLRPITA